MTDAMLTRLLDKKVEAGVEAAIKWLEAEHESDTGLFFRESDMVIDGHLDIRALVVAILEAVD
jgi:hypothetical protein